MSSDSVDGLDNQTAGLRELYINWKLDYRCVLRAPKTLKLDENSFYRNIQKWNC